MLRRSSLRGWHEDRSPRRIVALPCVTRRWGVISHNVTPFGHDLHDGGTFLHEVDGYVRHSPEVDEHGRERGRLRLDEGYTLEAVQQVLLEVGGPPGWEAYSGFALFAGFLVLDAFIANPGMGCSCPGPDPPAMRPVSNMCSTSTRKPAGHLLRPGFTPPSVPR